jgi:hypothetical protein
LDEWPLDAASQGSTICTMAANPHIRRLTLIPFEGPDDTLRRYRLARMDEIALATPPDPAAQERPVESDGASVERAAAGATPARGPARPRA